MLNESFNTLALRSFFLRAIRWARRNGLVQIFRILSRGLYYAAKTNVYLLNKADQSRETILVVSHEASRTGAPILALNLVNKLSKRYNVVVILLGSGNIIESFIRSNALEIHILNKNFMPWILILRRLRSVLRRYHFKYALVNSIESSIVLDALDNSEIPTISLIHEFAAYTRPRDAFRRTLFSSTEVVFSADIVRKNMVAEYPDLAICKTHLLPQGLCLPPTDNKSSSEIEREHERIRDLIRQKKPSGDRFIVLGAGSVQIRKGVDLFIDCAHRIKNSRGGDNFRFVWIGKGFDPENDLTYSAYLQDQICRSELQGYVEFIDETFAIEAAYEEADIFFLSSRLDPLPNVAIEVMAHRVPVVCFEKTTGIADFLNESGLGNFCVGKYLDCADLAEKILCLSRSKILYDSVCSRCYEESTRAFDMDKYVINLERVASGAIERWQQEQVDAKTIKRSGLFCVDFFRSPHEDFKQIEYLIRTYVRSWASGVGRRKPFSGFHPGIYSERHGVKNPLCDPFADYIRGGSPQGPWNYLVISDKTAIDMRSLPHDQQVSLHIHAYYPDALVEIIDALSLNQTRPDLFISVTDSVARNSVAEAFEKYSGVVKEIRIVPNLGRDIGPFLTEFGKSMVDNYEYVGHLHTKKIFGSGNVALRKSWNNFLIDNLLGHKNCAMADRILASLASDKDLGIVFPDDPNIIGWTKNRPFASPLVQSLRIEKLPEEFLFPIGTMFWAKSDALRDMIGLGLAWSDYPSEPVPYDGSTLHALERLFGFPAKSLMIATARIEGTTR